MSARRLLITRPQPAAGRTADLVSEAGLEPIVLPLSRTVAVNVATLPQTRHYDLVAVTSVNAIRHAPEALLSMLRGSPCHVVGPRTAEAARNAGLRVEGEAPGDVRHLAAQLIAGPDRPRRVLYLCGKVRKPDLEAALTRAGVACEALATYDTQEVDYPDPEVGDAIGWNPVWGAAVYSAGGARRLGQLMQRSRIEAFFGETRFFCLSGNAAAGLGNEVQGRSLIASEPNETALIELIRRA